MPPRQENYYGTKDGGGTPPPPGKPMRSHTKSRDARKALPPETAPSKRKLAERLGFSRQAVCQWARLPGAPRPMADGSEDVTVWRAFVRARGLGIGSLARSPERVAEITRRHRLAAERMRQDLEGYHKRKRDRG